MSPVTYASVETEIMMLKRYSNVVNSLPIDEMRNHLMGLKTLNG